MSELKDCPFCGMEVELKYYHVNGNDWWYIACNHCKIAMDPLMWNINRTKEETIEIWNRRYLNGMPITTYNIHPRGEE